MRGGGGKSICTRRFDKLEAVAIAVVNFMAINGLCGCGFCTWRTKDMHFMNPISWSEGNNNCIIIYVKWFLNLIDSDASTLY